MLFKVEKIDLQSNKRRQTITNRISVANVFFDSMAEDIGPILEKSEIEDDGSKWVASETHMINLKVIQID